MLTALPATDLLLCPPDVDELDLWSPDFLSAKVPATSGVYCFYDADSKEVLYIGSTCARSEDLSRRGLRARLIHWRSTEKNPTVTSKRIQLERQRRRILVRCWSVQSIGDAVKYEYDAIEKYKPILNCHMVKAVRSKKDLRSSAINRRQQNRARTKEELPSDTTLYHCPDCKKDKPLAEFPRNVGAATGHGGYCKLCVRVRANKQGQIYRSRSVEELPPETTIKQCTACAKEKPLTEFYRMACKDGHQRECKECQRIRAAQSYRMKNRSLHG